MSGWSKLLFETWIIATFLAFINLVIAMTIHLVTATAFDFFTASNLMIPEFGVMLILGSCLMGRQPLDDDKRYDPDGIPTKAWRYALFGRKTLLAAFFLLAFTGLFYLLGIAFPSIS
jgi:hypothetical protein